MVKKRKFAIIVDEHGKAKLYLKKLIGELENEYSFLKQGGRYARECAIQNAQVGEIIVFGSSKRFDFAVVTAEKFDKLQEERRYKLVNLQKDWKKVRKLLSIYAEANYPCKFEKHCCETVLLFDDVSSKDKAWWEDIIVLDIPRRKRRSSITLDRPVTKKKRKPAKYLDTAVVHHNFVKVGFDIFDIDEDRKGNESVKIDGFRYDIIRDSYGQGILDLD